MLDFFRKEYEAGRLDDLVEKINQGRAEGDRVTAQQIKELLGETKKTETGKNIQETTPGGGKEE